MTASMPAESRRGRTAGSNAAERFLDELFRELRSLVEPAVRDRVAHGLPPADRPTDELVRMMAAPLPRRSAWDEAVGPFHDTSGVAALLDVSRQALHAQREKRRVLALRTADGHWLYPSWQFGEDRRVLPGLPAVLAAAPSGVIDGWTLASWLRRSSLPELDGRTVVEHLRAGGDPAAAVAAAERSAARWAA